MKVININGTTDTACACGSWLSHWENFSGQFTLYCGAVGCLRMDVIGARVQLGESADNKWYIYPLCYAHNKHRGELDVSDRLAPVLANKKETCEKV